MVLHVSCLECGAILDLYQAMEDADGRRLLDLMKDINPIVIRPYFNYLKLFKPAKQSLRWSRMLTITKELAPMIKAAQIKHNGLTYVVPPGLWAEVMTALVETPPATLKLPLKGHGYLLSILAGNAEKTAAILERKSEEHKQHRQKEGVKSDAVSVSEILNNRQNKAKPAGWVKNILLGNTGEDTNA